MTASAQQIATPFLWTAARYHQLRESGILGEDDQVELINGELIAKEPISPRHGGHVKRLNAILQHLLGEQAIISVQDPIQLTTLSEPEPDLAVLHYRDDFYTGSHPRPAEIYLIIEVADTSLEKDRRLKLPIYAAAGIPEAWILDLETQTIERYTEPGAEEYKTRRKYQRGERLPLPLGREVELAELLPPENTD